MGAEGAKVGILVEDLYQDQEVWYPFYRLKEAGATVTVIGTGRNRVFKSKHGYEIAADTEAGRVHGRDFDALIVPGGYAPDLLRRDPAMVRLVKEADAAGKVIAAICHGGWLLCSAGTFKGKTATCFSAIKDDIVNAGAKYVDQEVARDGNLITSRKPDDLPAFMKAILAALGERTGGASKSGRPAAGAQDARKKAVGV